MEILKSIFDFDKPINFIAFVIILSLMILAIVGTYSAKHPRLKKYAKQSPAILATVGIFFSFYGITNGLIALDLRPEFIKDSIPNLLDGLKVKFISSLMGIGASIIVRVIQNFAVEEEIADINLDEKIVGLLGDIHKVLANSANSSPEALLQELKEEIGKLPIEFEKQTVLLESIKTSLVGDGEASLSTKLDKVRFGVVDALNSMDLNNKQRDNESNQVIKSGFDNLTQEFKNFAEKAAENNTKAIMTALQETMRDFNKSLGEQFGENFKRLDDSVGKLLTWQENYKNHVEQMTDKFDVALQSVEKIQIAFGDIQTRSESFAGVSTELSGILQKLDSQLQEFDAYLKGISLIANNAKDAFPIIHEQVLNLTEGFKASTEQSLNSIKKTVEVIGDDLGDTTRQLSDTTKKLRDSVEKTSDEFESVVSDTLRNLEKGTKANIETYQTAVTEQLDSMTVSIKKGNTLVDETIQRATDEFGRSISETGTVLKTSTDMVANHLTDATNSMKGMIEEQQSALTSASNQFETVVNQTLNDLSEKTQASIENYQVSLQQTVSKQLDSIDANIQKSNEVVHSTIQKATDTFEKSITETGAILKTSTNAVANDLTGATNSMKGMIEEQQSALTSTSNQFETVVNQTLNDLSEKTQASIENYQASLQQTVSKQLDSIDANIQKSNEIVNSTIQNVCAEFENAIKVQSESMNRTISTASNSFKTAIQDTAKEFEVMAKTIAESIDLQEKTLVNVSQDVKLAVDRTLRDLSEQSGLSIREYENSLHSAVTTASKNFNNLLTESTAKSTSVLEQQTQKLDAELQAALKLAIEKMGNHLASLSNRFVDDYAPLTEKLRDVVQIAKKLEQQGLTKL